MEGNITKGAPKGKGQDLGMGPPPGIKLCKLFPPRPAVYHTLNVREVDHVIWGIGTIYILYVAKEIRS